jgi:hypothetical protein
MKKLFALGLFLLLSIFSFAQDRSIGLRLGEPMGITYKKYLPGNKAAEFGLGTIYPNWHQQYYENAFHHLDRYDGKRYVDHSVQGTVYLQGRYLLQSDIHIEGMMDKLQWYWGIGALAKIAKVQYHYRDATTFSNDQFETRTDLDFGPEGILGMEYTFEQIPLTIFGEFSLMIEFADRPAVLRGFSGVGVRYNF